MADSQWQTIENAIELNDIFAKFAKTSASDWVAVRRIYLADSAWKDNQLISLICLSLYRIRGRESVLAKAIYTFAEVCHEECRRPYPIAEVKAIQNILSPDRVS